MKRILSIILTLSIVATLFAGLGISASAADDGYVTQGGYTYKETDYSFNHANATVPSTGSVVKNATISYWHYDAATSKTTHYNSWFNKSNGTNNADTAKLYDSDKSTQFQSIYDSNGTNYLKLKDGATQGSKSIADYDFVDDGSFYLQIQYDLEDNYGNGVDLSQIVVCGEESGWTIGKYDLFISDNIETLYDTPVKSFTCAETSAYAASNTYNSFSFKEGTTAKHVALRVYKFHTWSDSYIAKNGNWSLATPHFRMREFNVYGTRSTANNQGYELTSAAYNSTGGDQTLNAATAAGIGNNISTSLIRDCAPTEYKYSNLGATNTANVSAQKITQSNDFKRFDVNTSVRFAGTDNKGYKYIIDNENNYQQWIYALDAEADIDSIVVATNQWGVSAISGSLFAPYHVQYSLANNKDDLFVDGASTIYDVYNTDAAAFLTINLTEDVTAKFVGLRVVCGVNKLYPYTDHPALTGNNVAWARLSYFGVNGTYVNPAEATVEVEKDAAVADVEAITVSKGEVAQSGITDTNGKFPVGSVQVNATETYKDVENKLEYTFEGWYNGETPVSEEPEYTYDLTGGDVVLTAKYDVKNIVTKHTVTFKDWDGTELKTETVEEGNAATAPADPAREGYTFTGWDVAFDNVTSDLIVNAVYEINKYTVTFMADDKLVEAVEVEYGKAATAPAAPAKDGYTFVRWDEDFSNVTSDLTVTAQYKINEYTVTYEFEGEVVGTETVEHGKTANVPAVDGKEGYNVVWEYNNEAITGNTTIEGCYVIKTFTVNFYVEGKLVDTKYVDWNTAAKAPEFDAKYGYDFAWDKDFHNVTTDLDVNGAYTAKANNCIIKFESITGKLLGEVIVEEGHVPADVDSVMDQIKAINANVKTVYGYNIMRKDNGDVVWDADVYDTGIVNNITVTPRYEAIEGLNTNVKVYDVYGTKLIDQDARYDSAIYLASRQGAKYWADAEGKVLLAKETGTLYACGNAMVIKAVAEELVDAPAITFVSKINDGNFLVFAHVNVEGATEFGVIFSSSNYHDKVNADFTIEDVTPENLHTSFEVDKIELTESGQYDFIGTLRNVGNRTRYARAYIVVNGKYIYSDVIRNK